MPKRNIGLGLDVSNDVANESQEFSVSRSGTFKGGMFSINKTGIRTEGPPLYDGESVRLEDLTLDVCIGSGNSGNVHKAVHKPTNKILAVKEISVFEEPKRKQILKELETLYSANSPHLVSFFGAFYHEGTIYIALEFMDGGSLGDIYKATGPVPEPILSQITYQVLEGLEYLHRKRHMVHRDIKPCNILMNSKGDFKITDFGITAALENTVDDCRTFVGTVPYMSPERLEGESYSYESDIWSLGVTIVECASAKFPFQRPNQGDGGAPNITFWDIRQHLNSDGPPRLDESKYSSELCDFVSKCLQNQRKDRTPVSELIKHPFITKHQGKDTGYDEWVQSAMQKSQRQVASDQYVSSLLDDIQL
eukprot:gb/GECH01013013.1/.p1 GENE.gb/GECH01013013.1/~~gb/GECH01013013.1/.p1  ORF type:complete len:364 (+),score=91.35 gb/GECH01013013.1/:1-1092(+)